MPSASVFVSTLAALACSSKKTEASATGWPAELRTVPDTVMTGRGSAVGVCANVTDEMQSNIVAAATDRQIRVRCICKWLIGGILRFKLKEWVVDATEKQRHRARGTPTPGVLGKEAASC